jgi:hypothetical protein
MNQGKMGSSFLQTSVLPLGYRAIAETSRRKGTDQQMREVRANHGTDPADKPTKPLKARSRLSGHW